MESVTGSKSKQVSHAPVLAWVRTAPAHLTVLGLSSVLLYAFGLAARYPILAGLQIPRATWISLVASPGRALGFHVAVYTGVTLVYLAACQLVWQLRIEPVTPEPARRPNVQRTIVAVIIVAWLACSLVLMGVAPGGESHDVFDYLFRGRMLVELGANPLTETPREFSSAPYYKYVAWHSYVDTYGPVWEYASGGVSILVRAALQALGRWSQGMPSCPESDASCQMLLAYVTGYRLMATALAGLCGWLIFALVRRERPSQASTGLIIWLWNPLLLIASAVGAHNDFVMLALVLLFLWAFQRQYWLAGLLIFILAAHAKITVLVLAPVIGLWLARRIGWGRALLRGAVAILVTIPISWLLYAPLDGWGTLPRMLRERAAFVANSPSRLIYDLLYAGLGWPRSLARGLPAYASTILFAMAAIGICLTMFRYWRREGTSMVDDGVLWSAAAIVTVVYLGIGSFWFQHWYILWCLAPAALLPASRYTRVALPMLCLGALLGNLFADLLPGLSIWSLGRIHLNRVVVATTWLPGLATAVFIWTASTKRWRRTEIGHHVKAL